MARTIIEDEGTPVVRDNSGPALIVGLILGIALVVLAVLYFAGAWDDNGPSGTTPGTGTGNGGTSSAPSSQPSDQPSSQPSSSP